jgi:hypothetical protein
MAYGRDERDSRERSRFDEQREGSSRFDEQRERASRSGSGGEQGAGERGFFERAGDEISSWFGDDEAERRRGMDEHGGGSGRGDPRGQGRDDDRDSGRSRFASPDERSERSRNEPPRRPYSGRPPERSEPSRDMGRGVGRDMGRDMGHEMGRRRPEMERDHGYRPMTGDYARSSSDRFEREGPDYGRAGAEVAAGATAAHDRHYGEWRQRHMDEIDRDYEEYRREHQSKFESDFASWRSTRQSKRQMIGQIREHMEVFGSDEQAVGRVDKVRGDRIILTKGDSPDAQHHSVNCTMIDRVEGDKVYLGQPADQARTMFGNEERDEQGEGGAHILNRSFSGTY